MKIIQSLIDNLSSLESNLDNIASKAIKKNSAEIVTLVKRQLSHGKNSDDQPLAFTDGYQSGTGFYAESTQDFANRDGVSVPKTKGSPYNFHWTGETLDNMQMGEVRNGKYEIVTAQSKMSFLENIYGEIFSANEKNNQWVNEHVVEPELAKEILKAISF